ncbi:helicase [Salinicoccus sediminis]|uniref:Helicase n=1 Tax=Salinicoccus sediminis TaxID=1432562 RepID=A0A0M2SPG9_9STAP|nr:DEAD/DEAH box helicase [Salinicoccus sediminis]KKK34515.1 helicase [Salinicoccus sediminis]
MQVNPDNLLNAYERGFLDRNTNKVSHHPPKLIINSNEENILSPILDEMEICDSFIISVAFITEGGLATLKSTLYELGKRNVRGRIVTSTYLNFNKPKVFRELMKLENVDVKVTDQEGFHAKGYIFNNRKYSAMFIGSSNLTDTALKKNYEYNLKLTSLENGEVINHFNENFETLWAEAAPVDEIWIEKYEAEYEEEPERRKIIQIIEDQSKYEYKAITKDRIEPNLMQQEALIQLRNLRAADKNKGLVISATGTGKTYLSAFDVKQYKPKRMLFLAHREQILDKSRKDFSSLIDEPSSAFGVYSGNQKDTDAKYLFATVQTLSKEQNLKQFDPSDFDYIIIDEAHRSGAATYKKIIDYLRPAFLLGMTATPERTDDMDIFSLFDYNIAYEIRLQRALEEEILSPFHYFGVTDFEQDGIVIDETSPLSKLVNSERIDHITEKIEYYGQSGEERRGLMFVSNRREAAEMSGMLNARGYRTVPLTGKNSQEQRREAVRRLETNQLDYIITVDIFNEGVDIPSINQVVMLRQTQSSIIFVQQLGRGLRKHENKDYLTVIDFIGNYKNNYMIPIALTGDKSYDKDRLRKSINTRNMISGVSTINFEKIAKEKIYKSINTSTLNSQKFMREMYVYLKNKLGHRPSLVDFKRDKDTMEPLIIFSKFNHYIEFLQKIKEVDVTMPDSHHRILTFISQEMSAGKRVQETLLIFEAMQGPVNVREFQLKMVKEGYHMTDQTMASIMGVLTHRFFKKQEQDKYRYPLVDVDDGTLSLTPEFSEMLEDDIMKGQVEDVLQLALLGSENYDQSEELSLNSKYGRKDVCRLLNWVKDEASTMYGYKYKHGTCPIFITYHKDDEIEETIKYEDQFLDQHTLRWFTRSNRRLDSKEIRNILDDHRENGLPIYIFVKKDDDEGKDFYYLGKAEIDYDTLKETTMNGLEDGKPVVTMNMMMEHALDYEIYRYLEAHTH